MEVSRFFFKLDQWFGEGSSEEARGKEGEKKEELVFTRRDTERRRIEQFGNEFSAKKIEHKPITNITTHRVAPSRQKISREERSAGNLQNTFSRLVFSSTLYFSGFILFLIIGEIITSLLIGVNLMVVYWILMNIVDIHRLYRYTHFNSKEKEKYLKQVIL